MMSGENKLTVRVQSAEGTARVEACAGDSAAQLWERVSAALRLAPGAFALHRDRARRDALPSDKTPLRDLGLRHGDMLYLTPLNGARVFDHAAATGETNSKALEETVQAGSSSGAGASGSASGSGSAGARGSAGAKGSAGASRADAPLEDAVDLQLYQLSGNIHRQRDDKLCRHGARGQCVHCAPLAPWDAEYLRRHNIKHMSFHAYLRKITSDNFISLEELSCKIKPGCKEHPAWPRGICSSCQPGAVTLTRQAYRHVDNVLLERGALVERFLGYWRATGHQRLAFLYGRYEPHPDVPLGVRARVCALYEPAQLSSRDHIALHRDPKQPALERIAAQLGLTRVGWLFSDLLPDPAAPGSVLRTRGVDTHFLSAQECIMAGHFQNEHPNACRHATSGYFGSKFVTVCVTGDSDQQIHLEGYQVSGQCQALVRDGILLPTRDAPELGYIRDSSDTQFVPDVYYKEKDSYGNEVGVSAKRLPVAYLLVDVPCGVAAGGAPGGGSSFPPAHRALHHQLQTPRALSSALPPPSLGAQAFLEAVSDLHVLLYLATNEALPLPPQALDPLLAAVRARDAAAAFACRQHPALATLEQLARASSADPEPPRAPPAPPSPAPDPPTLWTCALCTFHNTTRRDACEMCAMPRNSAM